MNAVIVQLKRIKYRKSYIIYNLQFMKVLELKTVQSSENALITDKC